MSYFMVASAVVTAVGGGISAYNSYQAGKAQQAVNEYNAEQAEKVAAYNAQMQENQAYYEEQAMINKTDEMQKEKSQRLASQKASMAKNGVLTTSGSSLLTLSKQAGEMELDIQTMRYNSLNRQDALKQGAELTSYQGSAEASNYRWEGENAYLTGKANSLSGGISTVGSTMSAIGQAGSILK